MAMERQRIFMMQEDNQRLLTTAKLNAESKRHTSLLNTRKLEIKNAEAVLETNHAGNQLSLHELGKGGGGKVVAKKRRLEMLDRLARLVQGLSPAQRNDFSWFKGAWDARTLEEQGDILPKTFMGWMQRLLGGNEAGVGHAFSVFVQHETRRCFDGGASDTSPIHVSWSQWRR